MLLSNNNQDWNREVVNDIFHERDLLPLSISPRKDSLYWGLETKGFYTVKPAYYMLAETSSNNMVSNFVVPEWSKLWCLHVPARMKHFLWKCAVNMLPTKTRLQM